MMGAVTHLIDVEVVIDLIAKQLEVDPSAVSLNTHFVDDLDADEVKLTDLYLALEERFDVALGPDDCVALTTLSAVLRYLDSH